MNNKRIWIAILIVLFFIHPVFAIIGFICLIGKKSKKTVSNIIENKPIIDNNGGTQIVPRTSDFILKCTKCGSELKLNSKFCGNCGEPFDGNNVKVELSSTASAPIKSQSNISVPQPNYVKPGSFDSIFGLSEDAMINEFINRELIKAGIDKDSKLIPSDILKRRKILNIIFCVLVFLLVCLVFFHFPIFTYIAGIVILICAFKLTRMYNLMSYLKKQLKSRPSEKISNIVMSLKESLVPDSSKKIFIPGIIIAIILPLIIFIKPIIIYEKVDSGYAVRYYIFGVTNFTTATIPQTHNNENVISLRGNTFSNMPFLKEVTLPDTITEIRGQAFKNNKALKSVKLPNNLTYLGGGAFYGCSSLESIEIPDSVTYIGGEAFYKATKLKSVKLPESLTEIRGNTFEYCRSLESISIPDNVTRIGGHAFYGNSSLSSVTISENSKLTEIGSSAFRLCHKLYEIIIPDGVYVNERAFKESPTEIKSFVISNEKSYKYDRYFYVDIGKSYKVNEYIPSAIIQNEYISLVNIIENNGLYEYTFDINGQTFTFTNDYRYYEINSNLTVEIIYNYIYETYNDSVPIQVYYN